MKIGLTSYPNFNLTQPKSDAKSSLNYRYNLSTDTVSFCALKKSQLNKYQLLCTNYFKLPLEKFKTPEDISKWAKEELYATTDPNRYVKYQTFPPYEVDESITKDRTSRLKEWENYLLNDKEMQRHPELAYIIANSLTKELYPETKDIPPIFNKKAVQTTINKIDDIIDSNPKATINFKNEYQNQLRISVLKSVKLLKDKTPHSKGIWVEIPSISNDFAGFPENVKNLNVLSSDAWCTKGHFAEQYLAKGDIYIYMEKNCPELSVRMEGNKIAEVRDRNHNSKIPLRYFNSLKHLITQNKLEGYEQDLQDLEYRQARVDFAKSLIKEDIENKNYVNILKSSGIDVTVREDGLLELSHFVKPDKNYTYQDLGVNENDMFRHIAAIKGNANFSDTAVTNLGKLESIDGYVDLSCSRLNSLGNVKIKQKVFRD